MDSAQAKFEGWAVIELFGHQREAGFVTTEYYGDRAMFRLDVPEFPEREYELERPEYAESGFLAKGSKVKREAVPARSRLISPGAVYALNPCTEEAARKVVEGLVERKLILISLPPEKALKARPDPDDHDDSEYDHDEAYDAEETTG